MKLAILVCSVALTIAAPAQGGIVFNVVFDDVTANNGKGFDDPVFGATRRSTFQSVFNYLGGVLNHNGTIDVSVNASQTDGGGFLASAGPYFSGGPAGFQNGSAFTHATTGSDPFSSVPDIETTFDFGYNWNAGTASPTGSQFDLFTVALHEVTHGLGFLSLVGSSGQSAISGGDPGVFSVYDSFLERGDGTKLFGPGGDYLGTAADLTSGDVFFGGANAKAANGGNAVPVFAPGSFANGSSISHIQSIPGAVMQFSIAPGVERRAFTAQEIGILQDIGWNIQAVPEPSSLTLLLTAVVVTSSIRSRRRRSAGTPTQNAA